MKLIKQIFTWWNSQTIGTRIFTWRKGVLVGSDDSGNLFYETLSGTKRWVIFKNSIEASSVSSEWHGWLHFTISSPPSVRKPSRKVWEKPHRENKTGSMGAYHPLGEKRSNTINYTDYEAWSPDNDK